MKVRIQNFQSIADSSIEIDGFTVISGPNNCGKSVVIRAIEGVFSNKSGHSFVRHGAEHCTVTLEVNGRTVIWKKGKKVNQYVIDGKLYDKVGSNPPAELLDLKIGPIKTGGHEIWPQIAPQFTGQVFLLDQPGSVVAEAIADVERVGVLNKALKLCEADKRLNTSTLKIRRQDLNESVGGLTHFEGLDDTLDTLDTLKGAFQDLKDKASHLNELKDIHVRVQSQKEVISTLQSVEELDELPDCSRIQKMGKLLTYLQDKRDSITSLKELIQKLEPVLDSDEVYEVDIVSGVSEVDELSEQNQVNEIDEVNEVNEIDVPIQVNKID